MVRENEFGQPIGARVEDFGAAKSPTREAIVGARCRLERLDAEKHAAKLHTAYCEDRDGRNWTYLPYGPFRGESAYREWVEEKAASEAEFFFAIVDGATSAPVGVAAYLRIFADAGSIEIGHLSYSPALQRTPSSTEAMYLMMRRVFDDWGYRRYEWKCDSLNAPSRAAAARLGFRYEGVFRNHLVMKGRNRDTAWFSIAREEWPGIRRALEAWLDPANFSADGSQNQPLSAGMERTAGTPIVSDA